ncbi:MAG: CheR family methyltransferase [Marinoscillum sp.]
MERSFRFVVGIGASAGGLKVLKELVSILPSGEGMVYIIVQHLDPTQDSMLTEILQSESRLPIVSAKNGQKLEADNIYVIPPDNFLEVSRDKIKLSKPQELHGTRRAIDFLFKSISEEYGIGAMGIVLSGAGSDGTAGLRMIRASGGLTLAQDPDTAEHASMPKSAIADGAVDKISTIDKIPSFLTSYVNHPHFPIGETEQISLSEMGKVLDEIAVILRINEEFNLKQYKQSTVQRRIIRRMGLTGIKDFKGYFEKLRKDEKERKQLTQDLMINVTDFFRDPQAFEVLEKKALDQIFESIGDAEEIRIWVAGCASGEEVYSLAILFMEEIERRGTYNQLRIFATDVDATAIKVARAGTYPINVFAEVPEKYVTKYFKKQDSNYYRINRNVRDTISFAIHDVTNDPPFSKMHLISCRNLLIYLKKEMQKKVLSSFYFALQPNGILFLGSAETTGVQDQVFKTISKKWRIFQKINGKFDRVTYFQQFDFKGRGSTGQYHLASKTNQEEAKSRKDQLQRDLLNTVIPPTVIVSEGGQILYNHGVLDDYFMIPEGEPQNDFFLNIQPSLRSRMRSSIYKVKKSEKEVKFHFDIDSKHVRVELKPLLTDYDDCIGAVCITFNQVEHAEEGESKLPHSEHDERTLHNLELELAETKEELQNTVEELETNSEELKASNEEALSTNEELQAANEELEASSEELRSLNEELKTVNDQLKEKIGQLQSFNDDIENFFSSTHIPTIFLDTELRIQRFTPAARLLLEIGQKDIDKSIFNLNLEIISGNLVQQVKDVLENFASSRQEIELSDGRHFNRQITPYRTEDRRVEGVVIVFQEITELKRLSQRAETREHQSAVIARLGMLALGGMDLQDLMDQTVRLVAHTLDVDYAKILRYQPTDKNFLMISGYGWQGNLVGKATVPDDQDSQAGYTLLTKEPVIVKRLDKERRFSGPQLLIDHNVVSGVSCVIDDTNPYGVIGIHTKDFRDFTQEDATFILAVANLLSTAIRDKTSQEQLHRSEEQFRTVVNSIPQMTWMTNPDGSIFWYNQRWYDYTGSNFEESKDWGWQVLHHPDHVDRVTKLFKASIKAGTEWEDTFPIKSKDGEYRWFLSRARPIRNKEGEIINWFGTNTDITDQLQTEKKLSESAQKLRIATASNNIGAYEYYVPYERTEWDDILKNIWGLEPHETPTQETFRDGVHPDDLDRVLAALNKSMDYNGDHHYMAVYRVVNKKTKNVHWVEVTGEMIFEKEQPLKMIGMVIDITDRKLLEESMQNLVEELRNSNEKKNKFLATLGHELRNPLAAISNAMQNIRNEKKSGPKLYDTVSNNIRHINSLLDDLLDLTRIGRGMINLKKEKIDLGALLQEIVDSFKNSFNYKQQKVEFLEPKSAVLVYADRTRTEQVFSNLISNASNYTHQEGKIIVQLRVSQGNAIVEVEDNGIGLTQSDLEIIFEPFEQIRPKQEITKGLGIGLSLVKQFVEMHEGTVKAESEGIDQGCVFTVKLPLMDSVEEHQEDKEPEEQPAEIKDGIKILLVDDNEDANTLLKGYLESTLSCEIRIGFTGREAIEKIDDFEPDVLMLDIGLPDMDGHTLIGKLKEKYTKKAIYIAHTGYGHLEAREKTAKAGFDYHLNKPIDFDILFSILAKAR